MKLEGLRQAPFNTTMMGAMRGALDYYDLGFTDAFLYGASGHAFVINIHRELCPSGPYVWDQQPVYALISNLGLGVVWLGFFQRGSSADERSHVETRIRGALDEGKPCYLVNMEYQLITGYDRTGLLAAQPWPGHDFPPAHLTFGTWEELGDGIHMSFYIVERMAPADRRRAVADSLRYAVDLWRHAPVDEHSDYRMSAGAYEAWRNAVCQGHGSSHGNWWNGTVWAECRARAADYFGEIATMFPVPGPSSALAKEYAMVADLLGRCADKELAPDEKDRLLAEAAERETACIALMEELLQQLD